MYWIEGTRSAYLNGSLSASMPVMPGSDKEIPFYVPPARRPLWPAPGHVIDACRTPCNSEPNSPRRLSTFLMLRSNSSALSLGSLNPELYKSGDDGDLIEWPSGHIGRLWFRLDYSKEDEKLLVTLIKIRNLPARDAQSANCCDPFVRVYLSPDERCRVETRTRRKSCNPSFDETFTFNASRETLADRELRFVVYDIDSLKRNIPIGHVIYSLRDYCATRQQRFVTWMDLKKGESDDCGALAGELRCSLCYNNTLGQVTVSVIEARNLQPVVNNKTGTTDTFAKVSCSWLGAKTEKPKKTRLIKRNLCPEYNESFMFRIPEEKLPMASISIQIMQHKPDRQLGRVVLGGSVCSKGNQLQHWQRMCDNPTEVIQDWHCLMD